MVPVKTKQRGWVLYTFKWAQITNKVFIFYFEGLVTPHSLTISQFDKMYNTTSKWLPKLKPSIQPLNISGRDTPLFNMWMIIYVKIKPNYLAYPLKNLLCPFINWIKSIHNRLFPSLEIAHCIENCRRQLVRLLFFPWEVNKCTSYFNRYFLNGSRTFRSQDV